VKHGVQVSLHDVTCKYQKQNVEIRCLIVTELNKAIIDQKSIVFGELEAPVP
jgi:hypothetical protein